jgi:hypothetical protein
LLWLFWMSCPGWPWTMILPISASRAARIIDMSIWLLAPKFIMEHSHIVASRLPCVYRYVL